MKPISILLVDDHLLLRKGIIASVNDLRPDWYFGEASNGVQALELLSKESFNLVIVDVQMPVMGGIEFTHRSKTTYPDLPLIILTQFDEQALTVHFLKMGVNGFLYKNSDPVEIISAIEEILANGRYTNNTMLKALDALVPLNASRYVELDLSTRDKHIIMLLRQGKSSKQIASLMHLSEASVETYRKDLLHKTQTRNVAELVSLAHRTGII